MKFFHAALNNFEGTKETFLTRYEADIYLLRQRDKHPDDYEHATLQVFDIHVDSSTIISLLDETGGYCKEITALEPPQ